MAIDLNGLSVADLEKLIVDARARIETVKKAPGTAKPASKVAAKYRNPSNNLQTWTGRGKQPHWVRDAIAGGKTLEQLAI